MKDFLSNLGFEPDESVMLNSSNTLCNVRYKNGNLRVFIDCLNGVEKTYYIWIVSSVEVHLIPRTFDSKIEFMTCLINLMENRKIEI